MADSSGERLARTDGIPEAVTPGEALLAGTAADVSADTASRTAAVRSP
jgi:hypothetical protein